MLPLLLDLPSYYKFHKVEKLWRVKTRVFSYIRVKKIMFYTEFVTHQVDFAHENRQQNQFFSFKL